MQELGDKLTQPALVIHLASQEKNENYVLGSMMNFVLVYWLGFFRVVSCTLTIVSQ